MELFVRSHILWINKKKVIIKCSFLLLMLLFSFHLLWFFFRVDQSLADALIHIRKSVWCLKKPYICHDLHCYFVAVSFFFLDCRVHQLLLVYSWERLNSNSVSQLVLLVVFPPISISFHQLCVWRMRVCTNRRVYLCAWNVRNFVFLISRNKNKITSTTSTTTVFKICLSE